jgi:hypothetical protein
VITLEDNLATMQIAELRTQVRQALRRSSYYVGKELHRSVNKDILRKKDGQVYIIRDSLGRRRRHIASRPGDTHANMTGELRKSMGFHARGLEVEFGYGVSGSRGGPRAPHYAEIETGYGKVAPRPSLKNGIKRERKDIILAIEREIRRGLNAD